MSQTRLPDGRYATRDEITKRLKIRNVVRSVVIDDDEPKSSAVRSHASPAVRYHASPAVRTPKHHKPITAAERAVARECVEAFVARLLEDLFTEANLERDVYTLRTHRRRDDDTDDRARARMELAHAYIDVSLADDVHDLAKRASKDAWRRAEKADDRIQAIRAQEKSAARVKAKQK